MEDLEQFLKTSEMNSNYICVIGINYVPLILDAVRVIQKMFETLKMHIIQI